MRNRFLSLVAMIALTGAVCISCNKEKMPPPANAKKSTTTSSSDARTGSSSSSSDDGSNSTDHGKSGGCSHGG
ncbi:MAG: hypothetical protein ABUT20_37770 [Bacteroidota bacterium]